MEGISGDSEKEVVSEYTQGRKAKWIDVSACKYSGKQNAEDIEDQIISVVDLKEIEQIADACACDKQAKRNKDLQ